jgi:hypothetical protein
VAQGEGPEFKPPYHKKKKKKERKEERKSLQLSMINLASEWFHTEFTFS